MEGLQVSFVAGIADEVGESLLLDAPQDAAHHRRHGYLRHDDSLAGPERRGGCGGNWWLLSCLPAFASPIRSVRLGSSRAACLLVYVGWAGLRRSGPAHRAWSRNQSTRTAHQFSPATSSPKKKKCSVQQLIIIWPVSFFFCIVLLHRCGATAARQQRKQKAV